MRFSKPTVLFFSRDYQSQFYPTLKSENFNSIHVTLNKQEKQNVENAGGLVVACLEEEYVNLKEADITFPYLEYSIGSDRFLRDYSHEDRLKVIKKVVTFWANIMDTYKPDFVMNEVVALEISEILYIESKKRGIEYLATGVFAFENSFFFHSTPYTSEVSNRLLEVNPSAEHKTIARNYINKIREGAAENPHIKVLRKSKDIRNLINKLRNLLRQISRVFFIKNKTVRQICYYQSLSYYLDEISYYINYTLRSNKYDKLSEINSDTEVVFYPLHYEPEATLYYLSPYYDNQFALIENVLKCMKENQVLVIKEHPAQAGFLMQKHFRSLKRRFPNVKYLKADIRSLTVITRANYIFTLVSTAGFEAMCLEKPVIVFGKVYYNAYPGVNYCKTFEEVYDLLRGHKDFNKSNELEDFLSRMVAILNPGYPWPYPILYSKENIDNVRTGIENRILR
jgi:hypothetical protein